MHVFDDLALATSFLGVALGLFDYLADLFQRSNTVGGRLQTGAITFLPPLAFALFYPRGFVMALGYAGVALAVLALIIPSLLTWQLGVALGLFDYLADLFQRSNTVGGRLQTGAITFLPPLAFALFYQRGFEMALGYAGVALAVLALIIPSLLTWQSRKHNPQAGYRVKGGRPALVVVFLCGIAVIGVQFLIAAGLRWWWCFSVVLL